MTLTLQQLILSSSSIVSKRGAANHSMGQALLKSMGNIYYNNKTVIYDEFSGILEIRMVMGTDTETAYKGFHAVRIALTNVVGKIYNSLEDLYWDKIGGLMDDPTVLTEPDRHLKDLRKAANINAGTFTTKNRDLPYNELSRLDIQFGEDILSRLTGYIIPVANTASTKKGETYGTSGKIFYTEEGISVNNIAAVNCSCSDYYVRCGWYNYEAGAHLGPKPVSLKGRNNGDETVMNIHKSPGLCKHLMVLVSLLLNGGILNDMSTSMVDMARGQILKRDEKLIIPRKIAEGEQINRMWSTLTRNLKKAQSDRNISAGYKANYVQGYRPFKRQVMRENELARKQGSFKGSVTQGTSYSAYENSAIQRWADFLSKRGYK